MAKRSKENLNQRIVTEIVPMSNFQKAWNIFSTILEEEDNQQRKCRTET